MIELYVIIMWNVEYPKTVGFIGDLSDINLKYHRKIKYVSEEIILLRPEAEYEIVAYSSRRMAVEVCKQIVETVNKKNPDIVVGYDILPRMFSEEIALHILNKPEMFDPDREDWGDD